MSFADLWQINRLWNFRLGDAKDKSSGTASVDSYNLAIRLYCKYGCLGQACLMLSNTKATGRTRQVDRILVRLLTNARQAYDATNRKCSGNFWQYYFSSSTSREVGFASVLISTLRNESLTWQASQGSWCILRSCCCGLKSATYIVMV